MRLFPGVRVFVRELVLVVGWTEGRLALARTDGGSRRTDWNLTKIHVVSTANAERAQDEKFF